MAHVQTVLGPIDPAELGFTLPHEHTQIALWQIPDRWDYWQLTRDEPLILEELAAFREAGGRSLVDLTLPGVGRDPAWLTGIARASGLHVVMGCGWYRGAYYPAEALIDRRTVDDLADELVRGGDRWGRGSRRPPRASSARSAPTSRGCRRRRSASIARPPGPLAGPASRSRPTPSSRRSGSISCGSSRRRAPTRRGSSSATPTRTRTSTTTSRSSSAARASSSTSSACRSRAAERHGEGRIVELLCELLARGHVERILLSQDVCHDSQLSRYGGNGYTYLARTFLPRLRAAGVSEAEIETMTVANPRRLLTIDAT